MSESFELYVIIMSHQNALGYFILKQVKKEENRIKKSATKGRHQLDKGGRQSK